MQIIIGLILLGLVLLALYTIACNIWEKHPRISKLLGLSGKREKPSPRR